MTSWIHFFNQGSGSRSWCYSLIRILFLKWWVFFRGWIQIRFFLKGRIRIRIKPTLIRNLAFDILFFCQCYCHSNSILVIWSITETIITIDIYQIYLIFKFNSYRSISKEGIRKKKKKVFCRVLKGLLTMAKTGYSVFQTFHLSSL